MNTKRMKICVQAMVIVLFFTAVFLIGCATPAGSVKFPKASDGFQPKRTYNISYNKIWDVTNRVLEENRIILISADKSSGRITTDYIQGVSTVYGAYLGGVGNSRYKYNLRISREKGSKVKLIIIAKLESSLTGTTGTTPFRDVSQQNMETVKKLENWLYEKIETSL
jgi:hypothetical protein